MNPESEQKKSPRPTFSDSSYRMRPSILPHLDQLTGSRSPTPQKVEESWEKPEKTPLPWTGWIITFAALILLAAIIAYFGRTVSSESTMVEAVKESWKKEEKWHGPLPKDVAEQFTAAKSVEERLQFVRDPESIEPLLRDFYDRGPGAQEKVVELNSLGGNTNETSVFNRYEVRLSDGSNRYLYVVLKDHRAYVDFKAYSRYCSASWADLLDGAKREAEEVRVGIKVDRLFVGEFADEKKWLCFTARTPDCDECLYFYADKDSEAAKHLAALIEDKLLSVTVAIRARSDSHKRKQFEITRYHASSWCY